MMCSREAGQVDTVVLVENLGHSNLSDRHTEMEVGLGQELNDNQC